MPDAPAQQQGGSGQPDARRWRALAVCLAAGFMTLLDVSIVNVALPSIEGSLDAGPSQVQWIVAGYALAFGLVLVPAGRFGDLFSRRTVFLVGLAAFTVTSAGAGLVQSATALAVVRLVQGISAGILNPQVIGLLQELFAGPERGKAFGLFGTTVGVSTAVGPLLGGLLIQVFGTESGWRAVFLVNVPIGLVLLPFAARLLPRAERVPGRRLSLDLGGLALLAVGVVFLMLPFVLTTGQGDPPLRWLSLVPGVGLLVGFVLWERAYERRGREPVVPGALVRTASFTGGALVGVAFFAGFTGIFLVVTLYLQSGLGFTALQAGLVQTPFALASAVFSGLGGRFVNRWGRQTVVAGLVVTAVGLVAADVVSAAVQGTGGAVALAACLMVTGAGTGLVISPNQTLTLAEVPTEVGGVAGGVLQTGQRVGSAMGVALVSAVFFAGVASVSGGGPGRGGAGGASTPAAVQSVFGEALSQGLRVALGLVLLALLLALLDLRRRRRRSSSASRRAS
ncbi:MFS transporter, partial [Kineococcus siccus]|uniref:MFS transporter n=1 Tax=Kineococcus siccus TaxID=2696567 RepID=UPI0030B865B7